MRKVAVLLITILFAFCSASCGEDTTQQAKDEFSQYYNGKNEVVVTLLKYLYFEEYTLNIYDVCKGYRKQIFHEDKMYVLANVAVDNGYRIEVYTCDLYGKNLTLVYSKFLAIDRPDACYAHGKNFYIQYKKAGVYVVDKYNILTGIYENIYTGEYASIFDFAEEEPSRFNIEVDEEAFRENHGEFVITDLETGEKRVIDDEYLNNTIYIESMKKYGYWTVRAEVSNGHILLCYTIGAGDGWNYSYLIFEYDFENDTLEYKLLAFPYQKLNSNIFYVQ